MPETSLLPLFPLGTVLFPGIALPLHVFEERYRRMIDACLAGDRCFGVTLIRRGWEVGPAAEPCDVGTSARIARVDRLADGKLNLIVVGTNRFRIHQLVPGEMYLRAEAEMLSEEATDVSVDLVRSVSRRYLEYIEIVREVSRQESRTTQLPTDVVELSYTVAANLQVTRGEQQQLLEASTAHRLLQENQVLAREITLLRRLGAVVTRRSRAPADAPLN
jgi:Lon protease-like protein